MKRDDSTIRDGLPPRPAAGPAWNRPTESDAACAGKSAEAPEKMPGRAAKSPEDGAACPSAGRSLARKVGRRLKRGEVSPGSAWALVTGAGSGIGRCYALRLAAAGYNLVLAGNRSEPLEAVKREIEAGVPNGKAGVAAPVADGRRTDEPADPPTAERTDAAACRQETNPAGCAADEPHGTCAEKARESGTGPQAEREGFRPEVRIVEIDLARAEAAEELHAYTAGWGIEIDVLINNAGMFSFLDLLATPAARIERIILLHDLTNTQLCRLYAADMVRRGCRGHILNMSSYSLWMPFPGLSLYSASKAYLRSFSVAFAKEVAEHGIRVTAVCPAGVATDLYGLTPYWQRIGTRLGVLITADACARRGLKALWRGRRTIVPDWWNRVWIPLCKVLPMWALRPVRRFTMKYQK